MNKYKIKATKTFEIEAVDDKNAAEIAREMIPDLHFHLDIIKQHEPEPIKIKESDDKCEFDKDEFFSNLSNINYTGTLVPNIYVSTPNKLKYYTTTPDQWILVVDDILYNLENMVIDYVVCNLHINHYQKFYKNDYIAKFITDCQEELENSLRGNHDNYQVIIENIFIKWLYDL